MQTTSDLEDSAAECGVHKVISEDWMRWIFQSTDNPNEHHLVDLSAWELSGECSCQHFQFRILPLLRSGTIRPHEARARCKHIRRADRILAYLTKKHISQSNGNPNTNPN